MSPTSRKKNKKDPIIIDQYLDGTGIDNKADYL